MYKNTKSHIPYNKIEKFINLRLETWEGMHAAQVKYDLLKTKMQSILQNIVNIKDALQHIDVFAVSFRETMRVEFRQKLLIARDDYKQIAKQLKFYKTAFAVRVNIINACRYMRDIEFTKHLEQLKDSDFYRFNGDSYIWKTPYKTGNSQPIYMIISERTIRRARIRYNLMFPNTLQALQRLLTKFA